MRAISYQASLIKSALATCVLLLGAGAAFGQAVNLTAAATKGALPDGQTVPMWGYSCGTAVTGSTATCAASNPAASSTANVTAGTTWSPVVITVPYSATGTSLTINLTNGLSFAAGTGTNTVPTSLVIVGQLGGGLGTTATSTPSPAHAPQGVTWFASGSADTSTIVASVTLLTGGAGYTSAPSVTISGGSGTGATAIATVAGGVVTGIQLTSFGSGYTLPLSVSLTGGGATTPATASASLGDATTAGNTTFTPPTQGPRVQSFATEVAAGATTALTWTGLRPGTYLIESGTHPSIQGPMGLYGVLVVTDTAAKCAYPGATACTVPYDADVALLLSEIDAVQNAAVDAAVRTANFSETRVWSGQAGQCGDLSATAVLGVANTCYPPAVNYSPAYYLINGVSFDRTNLAASTIAAATPAAGAAAVSGKVLLRFVNAGLRMHVPSVVNAAMTLYAEDGNLLPGVPRVQSEVFLAAGKTYDVAIQAVPALGTYAGATYAVYDRQLSLSTNNQRDGGMQAYLAVAGGAATGVGSAASAKSLTLGADPTYYCRNGAPLTVSDPAKGVLRGAIGANGAALVAGGLLPTTASLAFQSDGTFTYTPPSTGACSGSFRYTVNGIATPHTATITECDIGNQVAGCYGGAPTARADSYNSTVGPTTTLPARLHIAPPGVLTNDTDPSGLPLTVDTTTVATATGLTVVPAADGSFTASATTPGTYTFTYSAKNSQGTPSTAAATVTVVFPAPSNLQVTLLDAVSGAPITSQDYRWIIEEDRTFYVDPACQVNSTDASLRPAACPGLPVQSLGYNFHTANMPVVAVGCVGPVSCESGQTQAGAATVCDQGNGVCHDPGTAAAQKQPLDPGQVALDPAKRYYISIAPADGINPTLNGGGGSPDGVRLFQTAGNPNSGQTNNLGDCTSFVASIDPNVVGNCGHAMGGAQISGAMVAANATSGIARTPLNIKLQRTPLPTAQIAVFVFEDDNPLNGENDPSGPPGAYGPAPNEAGLSGFNIVLFDQAGGLGDNTGQPTYDMFNQPLTNSLAGTMDPMTGFDACPLTKRADTLIGMIPVCPKYEAGNDATGQPILSPLVGQAIIKNLYPGLYEVQAMPAADRIAAGEEWLQTNTLDGGKPHEAFIKPNEPGYFQEFGPGGFHVSIGFANPKIINDRLRNDQKTGICDASGASCPATLYGQVTGTHMSRTPDQRTFSSGDYSMYGFTQCYIGIGPADGPDFALAKCDADGKFQFDNIPEGDFKLTVFDQWNDIMLDGLVNQVCVGNHSYTNNGTVVACNSTGVGTSADNRLVFPVTQWRTNLYTRTFIDANGDGVSNVDANGNPTEPGLALVSTNIRYRDGSFGFFNNTDLNGFAGWNEVFPFMNWLVAETTSTRYKQTGSHTVYDAGGPVDGTAGGGTSTIAAGLANTLERAGTSLPAALRAPGSVYCTNADCTGQSIATGPVTGGSSGPAAVSSGRIDPPAPWGTTMGFQGLLGQSVFMEFGMKPFAATENGGIQGHVIYASTRPFDDPALLLQLSWAPGVPRVRINLYQEGTAPDGEQTLKLVDWTTTTSFDDWAQGFRRDASGNPIQTSYTYTDAAGVTKTVSGYIPNMNCPGQDATSPFFQTLRGSSQWLDPSNPKTTLAADSLFKCYDGWSQLNQVQPAPYDGKYNFPSVIAVNPTTGKPAATNCTACIANPDTTDPFRAGAPMLPPGKYVVEVIVPPGYELVKEEDKNILMGDIYVAPVTVQFPGVGGNIFIMPDQAAVNAFYNKNNPINSTTNLGASPRHEGDTGSVEAFWACVGEKRIVPDWNSLYPGAAQNAPFAGALRPLCDRKEVTLQDQMTVLAKFYVFTPAHIAGHFTGTITNDFASEFDPFSPQFGEKFGPPNLPVGMRDFSGNEMGRVYSDQWGIYNGLYFSSWEVNPPNPTGYAPQMAIACMNDPGPIPRRNPLGQYVNSAGTVVATADLADQIIDPSYSPAYSNFCYETPFMPGFTAYMDTPVIPTQAFADGYNLPDSEYPDGTPAIDSVVGSSGVAGPWVSATGQTITIKCLGFSSKNPVTGAADPCSKVVQNPDFSGPGASTPPYNLKTITRHYGFGSTPGTVTIAGTPATCGTWSNTTLVCTVPAISATLSTSTGVGSTCASTSTPGAGQTPRQRSATTAQNSAYRCGELVITNATGQRSVDAVTVTVAGKPPTVVSPTTAIAANSFGAILPNPLQTAIDNAAPGDLIIVTPGSYKEHVIMWKPVRLQGVGAASVVINADAHPAGSLDSWRRQVDCVFGLNTSGVPISPDTHATAFDPVYSCPDGMFLRADRIPFEPIVGWDATGNGNLAQVLQEPTLMGAYEGAGVTVVGRGIKILSTSNDFWGIQASVATGVAGAFPDGSTYLTTSDCASNTGKGRDYATSNFLCNPSRIDGVSITNSSQGGGGIFMHGWGHFLEVGNTRVYGNHGTLTGGINLGNGETPGLYVRDNTICGTGIPAPAPLCPPVPSGTLLNEPIPLQINTRVRVHHNMIINNAGIGDALFSGTPSGAGGVTISAGGDFYRLDHNWIAANLSTGDGGGVEHSGQSYDGSIDHNYILFNQSTNPTLPTNGGGLAIVGSNNPRTLNGQECGTATDADCPPGLGDGTGKRLVIDANLILGNSAESGSGGGLRLQQVNGNDVVQLPIRPDRWYDVAMTNNIIANNIAGWDGGGVSMEDSFKVSLVNNTIASNDTTASAGVLFKTLAAINAASPPPGCTPTTDPTAPQNQNCLSPNAAHIAQPAGLVTMTNTPNMVDAITGIDVLCPAGFGYTGILGINGNCRSLSLPVLTNNLFWQNRAFHVEIVGAGTNLQSQQNLVAMVPVLNQTSTGFCAASGLAADLTTPLNTLYWDVGVRGDTSINGGQGAGVEPTLQGSVLSPGVTYTQTPGGTANRYPTVSPVVAQYCNGARVAPENGGRGFLSPPGASETTGLASLFVFNGITPAATVDEGHNWINLTYGPLTLASTANAAFSNAGTAMLAAAPLGPVAGAYSIGAASAAVNGANTAAAPSVDFFGNARPKTTANPADIGAVEFATATTAVAVVNPTALTFATVQGTTSTNQTLTLSNVGGAQMTGIAVTVTAPFARNGGSCGATLNAGASCTILVNFAAPATTGVSSGTATITGSVAVLGQPVALTGNSVARTFTASVGPSPVDFGNWATGTTSSTLNVDVLNTGNSALSNLAVSFANAAFSRSNAGAFAVPNCTATLAVGAACRIKVQFAPGATGLISGSLAVTANSGTLTTPANQPATITPASVTLTGTGVANRATVSISALTITLPSTGTLLQTTTAPGTVTFTNTAAAGGANIAVTSVGVTQPAGSTYTWNTFLAPADTCTGATLAPGASCTVGVRFTWLGTAANRGATPRLGTITFTDGGAGSPQVGTLTGIASEAAVAFRNGTADPTCLAGANVTTLAWGATAGSRTACVVNTGNGNLNVNAVAIANQTLAQFASGTPLGTACTATTVLTPGTFCTVVINRTGTGTAAGTLSVTDAGAPTGTQTLNLTGT